LRFIWSMITHCRWIFKTYFNFKYRIKPDPYQINTSRYEQTKIAKSIEKIRGQKFSNVLEIGCGAGYHTEYLLPFSDRMVCIDNSGEALKRARERISDARVTFKQLDLVTDNLDEKFDLIFCSEVLYYLDLEQLHAASARIIDWLNTGGTLILVHALVESKYIERSILKRPGARTIHSLFMDSNHLYTVHDTIEKFYRITVLKKLDK